MDGDPYRSDPYRTAGDRGPVGPVACPRCGGELAGPHHARLDCTTGKCGEFWPRDTLDALLALPEEAHGLFADMQRKLQLRAEPPPATCPICKEAMHVAIRARVVFDYCSHHGVWLDRNEREALERAIRLGNRLFDQA
jgi:Zn-finger nucleic acid-binding protein